MNARPDVDHGPRHPWLTCVVPMIVFLGLGTLEPGRSGGDLAGMIGITGDRYPVVYAVRVAATLLLVAWAWPNLRGWLGAPTWWPPVVGLLLMLPWVALARLQHDAGWLVGGTERAGFNPFAWYGEEARLAWVFLAVRGLGLVVLVPVVEELFVRGFLMRFVIREDFWKVPFGEVTIAAAVGLVLYAVASHPAEAVAAVGWFAVVTGIAAATRRPIDCILTHATTNLALGAYVLATGNWWLL